MAQENWVHLTNRIAKMIKAIRVVGLVKTRF